MKPHIKKVRRKIKRSQTYRTLKKGETIRKGDEIGNGAGVWWPCADIGHKSTGLALLRRKITESTKTERKPLSKRQVEKNREENQRQREHGEGKFRPVTNEGDFIPLLDTQGAQQQAVDKMYEIDAERKFACEDDYKLEQKAFRKHLQRVKEHREATDEPIGINWSFSGDSVVHETHSGAETIAAIPAGVTLTSELAHKLWAKSRELGRALTKEESEQLIDPPALDIQVDTGKPLPDWMRNAAWNEVDLIEKDRKPMVVAIVVCAVLFHVAFLAGYLAHKNFAEPEIQYRDKIEHKTEYSRPMELQGIPDNPWRKAIPLLPEDIKIERKQPALDRGETRKA